MVHGAVFFRVLEDVEAVWHSAPEYQILDNVAIGEVRNFETELFKFIESRYPQVFRDVAEKKQLDDQLKGALNQAVKEFAGDFTARKASAA